MLFLFLYFPSPVERARGEVTGRPVRYVSRRPRSTHRDHLAVRTALPSQYVLRDRRDTHRGTPAVRTADVTGDNRQIRLLVASLCRLAFDLNLSHAVA
jgi:hypothetical protein